MENPIKIDDLGIPLFSETSTWLLWGKIPFHLVSPTFLTPGFGDAGADRYHGAPVTCENYGGGNCTFCVFFFEASCIVLICFCILLYV